MWSNVMRTLMIAVMGAVVLLACKRETPGSSARGRNPASDGGAQLAPPEKPLRPSAALASFVSERPGGQPLVARGERWVFTLRWNQLPDAVRTDLERGLHLFAGGVRDGDRSETITSVGVEEIRFDRVNPGDVYGQPDEWRFRPELTATRMTRPPYVSAARETLSVGGRAFPCVVLGHEESNGRVDRTWIHVGDGDVVLFPGLVKQESAGKVVLELTRIEPAPRPKHQLDLGQLTRMGERWIYVERHRGEREVAWTVTGMLGDEVKTSNRESSSRTWRWQGEPFRGKILARETVSVSGRAFPCIVVEEYRHGGGPDRKWLHVDPEDVVLFPGHVRWERDGVLVEELVRIEAP